MMTKTEQNAIAKAVMVLDTIGKNIDLSDGPLISTSENQPYLLELFQVECELWDIAFSAVDESGNKPGFKRTILLRDDNLEPVAYQAIMKKMTRPIPIKKNEEGTYYLDFEDRI